MTRRIFKRIERSIKRISGERFIVFRTGRITGHHFIIVVGGY